MMNEYEKENALNVCKKLKKLGLITSIVEKNYSIEILINIDDNSEEESRKIRDRIKENFETQGYKVNIKGTYWLDIIFVDIIQRVDDCFSEKCPPKVIDDERD